MKNRLYGIVLLLAWSGQSEAMESHSNAHDLVALTNIGLSKAKRRLASMRRHEKTPENIKQLFESAFTDSIQERGVTSDVLPAMRAIIEEEFKIGPRIYDTITLDECNDVVTAVDMSSDGGTILASVGNTAYLWTKGDSWIKHEDAIRHGSRIAAVCLAANRRVVTLGNNGTVFVQSYNDWEITQETAFCVFERDINIIALNDAGDRLVCGNANDGTATPLSIYKRTAAHWRQEEAVIPAYKEMSAQSLYWGRDDTIVVYGKPNDAGQDDRGMLTEWKRIADRWYCI